MKVMAGFFKDEPYFVARLLIGLPLPMDALLVALFGDNIARWKREAASSSGDKTMCGQRFLTVLLPHLVTVLVQDGIYFVRDFPNHPMTTFLMVSLH